MKAEWASIMIQNMVIVHKVNLVKCSVSHLNSAEGVEARTWLPSGDQDRKVTPPPPTR